MRQTAAKQSGFLIGRIRHLSRHIQTNIHFTVGLCTETTKTPKANLSMGATPRAARRGKSHTPRTNHALLVAKPGRIRWPIQVWPQLMRGWHHHRRWYRKLWYQLPTVQYS